MERNTAGAAEPAEQIKPASPLSRLIDLKGLGKEIWQDEDTQDYINRLRDEWDW